MGSGKGFLCGLGLGEIEGGWSGFGAGGTEHVGQRVVRDLLVSLMTVNYHACRVALSNPMLRHACRNGEPVGVSEWLKRPAANIQRLSINN